MKKAKSFSIDESIADTTTLKSSDVNTLLTAISHQRLSLEYVESILGTIDYSKLIEAGVASLKDDADKYMNYRRYQQSLEANLTKASQQTPLDFAIRNLAVLPLTWGELVELLIERYPAIVDVKPTSAIPIANQPFYYEAQFLSAATQGRHIVNNKGEII